MARLRKKKFKLSRRMQNVLMISLLILGVGVLIFPDISNWYHSNQQEAMRQEYNEMVAVMEKAEIEYELERARSFNAGLTGIHIQDPFIPGSGSVRSAEYYSILNFSGIMGQIEIPRIGVNLSIFHGTADHVLARGVGHMENTPFPVGGYGNHAILTGHTGLVNAKLFTDLIRLEYGDKFFIQILNERLAYQIEHIEFVYPHEIEGLYSDENHDWITLVTCYPYGVNTHRLLVRGTRIDYEEGIAEEIENITTIINIRILVIIGFGLFFATVLIFYQIRKSRAVRKKIFDSQIEEEYENIQNATQNKNKS